MRRPQKQCRALSPGSGDQGYEWVVPSLPLFASSRTPRPQDRKTVARTALLEGGGGAGPNRGQDFSEFTV